MDEKNENYGLIYDDINFFERFCSLKHINHLNNNLTIIYIYIYIIYIWPNIITFFEFI